MSKKKEKPEKKRKKSSFLGFLLFICLIGGGIGGFYGTNYLIKNDKFEIVGEKEIHLNVGDVYNENSAIAIAFGKDISKKVKIEEEIDTSKPGQYLVKYTVDSLRYKNVARYRIVVVEEPVLGEGGER